MRDPFVWIGIAILSMVIPVGCRSREESDTGREHSGADDSAVPAREPAPLQPVYEVVDVSSGGSVRGTVRVSGTPPVQEDFVVNKDPNVCGESVPDLSLRLGPGGTVERAVVSLTGISSGRKLEPLTGVTEIEVVKCTLVPHLVLVPIDSTLELVNSDPILHVIEAFADSDSELFQMVLPIQDFRAQRKLDRPGWITLRSGAGHTWMRGYVIVQEHPYYATTDADGSYALEGIPPGSYRVRVWHESLEGQEAPVTISPEATETVDFELSPDPGTSSPRE